MKNEDLQESNKMKIGWMTSVTFNFVLLIVRLKNILKSNEKKKFKFKKRDIMEDRWILLWLFWIFGLEELIKNLILVVRNQKWISPVPVRIWDEYKKHKLIFNFYRQAL